MGQNPKIVKQPTLFGQKLKAALSSRDLMQVDLAEKLSVSSAYVSSISTGSKGVSASTVSSIARALDLDQAEAVQLHRAAASDLGFDLNLTDDFSGRTK